MKKKLLLSLLFVSLILLSFLIYFSLPHNLEKLPEFVYHDYDGNEVNNEDITTTKPLVICYFSTHCGSCGSEMKKLQSEKYIKEFKVIYITSDTKESLKNFLIYNKLTEIKIEDILIDTKSKFPSNFSLGIYITYPTILFFDTNGNMVKKVEEL